MMSKERKLKTLKNILLHIFLLIAVLISVFPFYWMLSGATNSSVDITSGVMWFGKNLKENWTQLQETANVFLVCWNTIKTTLLYTFLSILICAMAGYGFEKYRRMGIQHIGSGCHFKQRNHLFRKGNHHGEQKHGIHNIFPF